MSLSCFSSWFPNEANRKKVKEARSHALLVDALIPLDLVPGGWMHKTNVVGTLNMLGLAKRVGARFLLTSTSEVYGDPLQHPQVETYWGNVNPIGKTPSNHPFHGLSCLQLFVFENSSTGNDTS